MQFIYLQYKTILQVNKLQFDPLNFYNLQFENFNQIMPALFERQLLHTTNSPSLLCVKVVVTTHLSVKLEIQRKERYFLLSLLTCHDISSPHLVGSLVESVQSIETRFVFVWNFNKEKEIRVSCNVVLPYPLPQNQEQNTFPHYFEHRTDSHKIAHRRGVNYKSRDRL